MWFYRENSIIDSNAQYEMMTRLVEEAVKKYGRPKKALLLPPDITRFHSGAGILTNMLYHILGAGCETTVIPTLGQHVPHTPEENRWMFGDIPEERILKHDWKNGCAVLGEISGDFVKNATGGLADWPIPVEINREVTEGEYDLVINIGQVVPHEVLGFANHNKNYFIGLGGKKMICASHITAALCGIENNLGQVITPLRGCYNYAEAKYMKKVPAVYALIVKSREENNELKTTGLYVGDDTETYVKAARYAREKTVFMFDRPIKKAVCFMDGREFRSTWVANKAVYRTRKVIADGGELLIIAPGVERFGEQPEVDRMIRKYGYKGTPRSLDAFNGDKELHDLAHAAAHLIHGSSEGRFNITYAPGHLTREETESVGYGYMDIEEALKKYNPDILKSGFNTIEGEEIYFIDSPSLGLWTSKAKFKEGLMNNMSFGDRMIAAQPNDEIWKSIKEWNCQDITAMGFDG
ncbi:MAG: lactate racemase domain-containing protein [Eubacteriales bacterium]|nr:lactate racemase domain-containing protein [Eubacteriales bacterium]